MGRRRNGERLVGQVVGEEAGEGPDRQVLVDNDHGDRGRSVVRVVGPATEQRIGLGDGRQGIGELVGEVAHRDAEEDGLAFLAQPGVARPTLAPELCEQLFALGHFTIVTGPGGRWIAASECYGRWPERETPGGRPKSPARRLTAP